MRQIRYKEIASQLRARLEGGEFGDGHVLPSEAELSAEYDASRVTIRRALEELRGEGLVDSRQGFGWFVAAAPLRQSLARLGTIEEQLTASGHHADRRILDFGFVEPADVVAETLGTASVLKVRRITLADKEPFALVTVWCPAALANELSRSDVEREPFLSLLDVAIGGATQTIGAAIATEDIATLLEIPVGSPLLRAERVTHDIKGNAILYAEHLFAAHRTEFVVELPTGQHLTALSGLRLIR